ncbi:MAG: hypothetical protein Kow0025_04280 [Thermodesulfovibrionales bacterium]
MAGLALALAALLALLPASAWAGAWEPAETLRTYLMDNYPWEEIEVTDLRTGGEGLPGKAPERILLYSQPPGTTVFGLVFADASTVRATARVKAFERVVKARRPLERGRVLAEEDLYEALVDVSRLPRGAVAEMDEAVGKVLTRSVPANRPIVSDALSDSPRLARGRKVVLLLESNDFRIEAAGELKESARVGAYVKAENLSSGKTVMGELVDENTVVVGY